MLERLRPVAIRPRLLEWGRIHLRSFPWRDTRDPYRVLIAEVLLHRTRAKQVAPVYENLIQRFPTLETLATAELPELTELMYSLGLPWRVPLLLDMAQILEHQGNGVPDNPNVLMQLPGVGPYIAHATVCFAFDKPEPLLDTNTVRVVSRLTGEPVNDGSRRSRRYRESLETLVKGKEPRLLNFALLDFAASVCRAKNPLCRECVLRIYCFYGRTHDD